MMSLLCNGSTESQPFDKSSCLLASDSGPCRGYIEKYFFNSETKQCERFIYGGCRGIY
jgi:hypothetical protein